MELWNSKGKQNTITEALQIGLTQPAVISLTGAGGKTSLMTSWAHELASSGKRAVITTTTHIFDPAFFNDSTHIINQSCVPYDGIPFLHIDHNAPEAVNGHKAEIERMLEKENLLMVISSDPERPGKAMAPPDWVLSYIYETADAVLIEADGSRRKPFKWPAPWEPVIPEDTNITVCVAGLSSLGCKTHEAMYRPEDLPPALRRDTIDETLVSSVLASPDGGKKLARGEFRVFLNQADTDSLQKAASRISAELEKHNICSAWGSLFPHQ